MLLFFMPVRKFVSFEYNADDILETSISPKSGIEGYTFSSKELVGIKNRNMTADADEVVRLYNKRTELVTALQELQTKRNENAKSMKGKLPDDERKRLIEEGKALKEKIAGSEKELADTEAALDAAGRQIPNMAHPDAPIGKVDSENLEVKKVGTPRKFDFEPKDHVQLMQDLDLIDFDEASNRFRCTQSESLEYRCFHRGQRTPILLQSAGGNRPR